MSIKKKLNKIIEVFGADYIVYQPGRVGSTEVVESLNRCFPDKKTLHLHSVFIDRNYCLKMHAAIDIIASTIAKILVILLMFSRLIRGKKYTILVPYRDNHSRDISVFSEYFEEIVLEAKKQDKWYRKYYKGNSDDFIKKCFLDIVRHNGQDFWMQVELQKFSKDVPSCFKDDYLKIINTFFDIHIFRIERPEKLNHSLELDIGTKSKNTNTSNEKWCSTIIGRM